MGYASNLKKIRKYSINEIEESLKRLDNSNLSKEEIFKICEETLKLIEVHFNIGRKDSKFYNKYNKQVKDKLYKTIYKLDLVKEKDKSLTIKTLMKKDYDFLYVLLLDEIEELGFLYSSIRKNIPSTWLKTETLEDKTVKYLPEINDKNELLMKQKDKILEHIKKVYDFIKENKLEEKIKTKERYKELQGLIKMKLSEMEKIKNETFEQSFYRYSFQELNYLYKDIDYISSYVLNYIDILNIMFNKDKGVD